MDCHSNTIAPYNICQICIDHAMEQSDMKKARKKEKNKVYYAQHKKEISNKRRFKRQSQQMACKKTQPFADFATA